METENTNANEWKQTWFFENVNKILNVTHCMKSALP